MKRIIRHTVVPAALALGLSLGAPYAAQAQEGNVPGTLGAVSVSGDPEAPRPAFYEPPADIPAPGRIIRSEPAQHWLDPLNVNALNYDARRIMYSSTDGDGRPMVVTGIVAVPKAAWTGPGKRPLIAYAPGTQGMADACAPSRQLTEGFEYEKIGAEGMLKAGYALVMTDYQGLGTPGSHTYMARESQGHAVLDSARAAQTLSGTGLAADTPVGLMGYSQGGGGSSAAAELASSYAPGLQVKGTATGAVPANLAAVAPKLDGSFYAAFLFYALVGQSADAEIDPAPLLNDKGVALMSRVEKSCVYGLGEFSFKQSKNFSADGRPITAYLDEEPYRSAVADNRIGGIKPDAPVLLSHSRLDDVIPYQVGAQLNKDWCSRGATVQFVPNFGPTHLGGYLPFLGAAKSFFSKRFAGQTASNTCA